MKTDVEVRDDVYSLVKGSPIMEAVTGGLYAIRRPMDSEAEDVTVAVLANVPGDPQRAYVNVNIFVRDIKVDGRNEENIPRVRELSRVSYDALRSNTSGNTRIVLEEQRVYEVEATGEHMINCKLKYLHVEDNV